MTRGCARVNPVDSWALDLDWAFIVGAFGLGAQVSKTGYKTGYDNGKHKWISIFLL